MIYLKKAKEFLEGNFLYYKDMLLNDSPEYIKEQITYRLNTCKDDCLKQNKCIYCGCPPAKKAWVTESCNKGDRFPNLMDKPSWEKYKTENNIIIEND